MNIPALRPTHTVCHKAALERQERVNRKREQALVASFTLLKASNLLVGVKMPFMARSVDVLRLATGPPYLLVDVEAQKMRDGIARQHALYNNQKCLSTIKK